ncbi:unnamed protein product [Commensalibacter communis]|uniref:hypothetical protein n=1 Tax=Commensalibacter communis TaxID=2972786 RepID=UPI0022FF6104|nr:hypothetical protein [Commensalibacter communis]CAI3930818.1 unnamed protein product [Commensalibacter communis]
MQIYFNHTKPFQKLQKNIGNSTYLLNTIFVGLNCVTQGQGDGGAIAVTWKKPKNKQDCENITNQAKNLICTSALVLGADTVDCYLKKIVDLKYINLPQDTIDIVGKKITKPQGSHYSITERVNELFYALKLENNFQSSILGFLSLWRNLIAHMENIQERKLDKKIKDTLLSTKDYIHDTYAHLSIKEAIENYESQKKTIK